MSENIILGKNQIFKRNDGERNNNILTIASSGSGKTYSIFQPNILELSTSNAVILDPKGQLYKQNKEYLENIKGYKTYMIDFDRLTGDVGYDPLENVASEEEVYEVAYNIVFQNPRGRDTVDPYWDSMAATGLLALSLLAISITDNNYFLNMLSFLNKFDEEEAEWLENIFSNEDLQRNNPLACESFNKIIGIKKSGADKTYACVISSMHSVVHEYSTKEFKKFLKLPSFDFEKLINEKVVLFVKISDTSSLRYPYVSLFMAQMFRFLISCADNNPNGRLKREVIFFLDDFASTLNVQGFGRIISTSRSRGISFFISIQDEPQLESFYGKAEKSTIIGNCDNVVFLGATDIETAENISIRTNKPVYDILSMPIGNEWVFRRGEKPVFTTRFNYKLDHKEYLKIYSLNNKGEAIVLPGTSTERVKNRIISKTA